MYADISDCAWRRRVHHYTCVVAINYVGKENYTWFTWKLKIQRKLVTMFLEKSDVMCNMTLISIVVSKKRKFKHIQSQWLWYLVWRCRGIYVNTVLCHILTEKSLFWRFDILFCFRNVSWFVKLQKNQGIHVLRFAHPSKTAIVYLQIPCNILPVLPQ